MSSELRGQVWTKLDDLVRHHRAFAHTDADWVLPTEELDRLAELVARLRPEDPAQAHAWLFAEVLPDTGTDPTDHGRHDGELARLRQEAVRAVVRSGGREGLLRFVDAVVEAGIVGNTAAACDELALDDVALELVDAEDRKRAGFAFSYLWSKTSRLGPAWAEGHLRGLAGRPVAQARILAGIDDLNVAWLILGGLDPEVARAYWKEFRYVGRGDFPLAGEAAKRLVEYGHPAAATDLLAMYAGRAHPSIFPAIVATALDALTRASTDDASAQRVSAYDIGELLEYLRTASFDEGQLATLEWRLLPAREFKARSPVLERYIAREPGFFVELISLVYKPRQGEEPMKAPEHVIRNAYRLLHEWSVVPGTVDDGTVDPDRLMAWITDARDRLVNAKRLEVGDIHIGHVFASAGSDADGSWPVTAVRDAIQRAASAEIEDGLATQIINQRGVTSRGLLDGGEQERVLARSWREKADRVRDTWPRVAAALDRVVQSYEQQALAFDAEVERRRQELDD